MPCVWSFLNGSLLPISNLRTAYQNTKKQIDNFFWMGSKKRVRYSSSFSRCFKRLPITIRKIVTFLGFPGKKKSKQNAILFLVSRCVMNPHGRKRKFVGSIASASDVKRSKREAREVVDLTSDDDNDLPRANHSSSPSSVWSNNKKINFLFFFDDDKRKTKMGQDFVPYLGDDFPDDNKGIDLAIISDVDGPAKLLERALSNPTCDAVLFRLEKNGSVTAILKQEVFVDELVEVEDTCTCVLYIKSSVVKSQDWSGCFVSPERSSARLKNKKAEAKAQLAATEEKFERREATLAMGVRPPILPIGTVLENLKPPSGPVPMHPPNKEYQ